MSSILYRVGAWCWIVTGLAHLIIDAALSLAPASPDSARLNAAMRAHAFAVGGIRRTTLDLFNGISITMGLAIAVAGVLFLMIARFAETMERARGAAAFGLVASLTSLAVAVVFLPIPPIVTFTVSSTSFGVSLWKLRATERALPSRTAGSIGSRT